MALYWGVLAVRGMGALARRRDSTAAGEFGSSQVINPTAARSNSTFPSIAVDVKNIWKFPKTMGTIFGSR